MIVDDAGTEHVFPQGFDPKKAAMIVKSQSSAQPTDASGSGLGVMASAFQTAKDVGAGFAKAAGRSVKAVADDLPHAFGGAGLSDYIDLATGRPKGESYQRVSEGLQSKNAAQTAGGLGETALELALPIGKAVEAIPTTAKAGPLFQQVMSAAKNVPVNVEPAGQAALRISQLAERGGRLPKPVNDFLKYVTNPEKPQLTYEAGRDFLQNLGKLSVNERNSLTPVIQREVAIMTSNLAKAVADAAAKVGHGETYAKAMTQYARAKGIANIVDDFLKGARKSLPWMLGGSAAAAGAYGAKKVIDTVGGGE